MAKAKQPAKSQQAESYNHPEAKSLLRPDVGTQAQFRKKKPPTIYRYDSSVSPALDWDGQNPAREQGEALIKRAEEIIAQEKAKAIKELRQEVLDISLRVTEKVVGQMADPALQRRVVDKVFVELEAKKQA